MNRENYNNRTNVSFSIKAYGVKGVHIYNHILSITKKHKAQVNLFQNKNFYSTGAYGSPITEQLGSFGGAITFHAAECDHAAAADELICFLGIGCKVFKEAIKTHRKDGTPYKLPQHYLEEVM